MKGPWHISLRPGKIKDTFAVTTLGLYLYTSDLGNWTLQFSGGVSMMKEARDRECQRILDTLGGER